jgi:hypothetical protein
MRLKRMPRRQAIEVMARDAIFRMNNKFECLASGAHEGQVSASAGSDT